MIEYVSASAPAHVVDGWSFLSRGVDCAVRGDTYSALHFGYYAELRAAMGLLASEGVGIFNQRHPAILKDGTVTVIPKIKMESGYRFGGTHAIVWPCLEHWAQQKSAERLFDHIIQPAGVPLSRWMHGCGLGVSSAAAYRCMSKWGVDLAATNDDHSNRNLVSYRPSCFRSPDRLAPAQVLDFVEDLWRLFEPSAQRTRFQTLEQHLLKQILRMSGVTPSATMIESLGIDQAEAINWSRFLASNETLVPLDDSQKKSDVDDSRCHLQVLSRAALILFLASASTRRHLAVGGFDSNALSFWWHQFGVQRGLWPLGGEPDDSLDFWSEVTDSLDEIRAWRTSQPADFTLHTASRSIATPMRCLAGFEIGSIWGLLP
ncbi:MAG: hypothetical protein IPG63_17145 [Xanthomonadales bacterium]|nr:hypothetical protein [Xanthomonadales bacterium]